MSEASESKKIQQKGGTCLGDVKPTWLKQDGDVPVVIAACVLMGVGMTQLGVGYYRLAFKFKIFVTFSLNVLPHLYLLLYLLQD